MRQLFSSARIENVEAVARMLEEAGIEVRISHGRSYRGAIRGNFSYRDNASGPRPSVWVIRSDQQPEARRMLREAGLLQDSPIRGESFLPSSAALAGGDRGALAPRGGGRFRYGLLLAVAVLVALVMISWRAGRDDDADVIGSTTAPAVDAASPRPAPAPATPDRGMPVITSLPDEAFVIATPAALAATVLRAELASAGTRRGCLSVDGADPDPALLAGLAEAGLDVVAASACGDGALAVAVSGYTTDGSGSGTLQLVVGDAGPRVLEVRREGREWRLGEPH